jgi:predicted transcriptional regulator
MLNVLSVLCISGRIARIKQGVYAPAASRMPEKPELRQVMWRVLRMRRRITVEDLQTMAGSSYDYAAKWLRMLEDKGVVRRIGTDSEHYAVWQLIATDAEMPADDKEMARLREYRAKRKVALAKMRSARTLINQAIEAMEEEDEG